MSFWKNISDFTMEVIAPVLSSDEEEEIKNRRHQGKDSRENELPILNERFAQGQYTSPSEGAEKSQNLYTGILNGTSVGDSAGIIESEMNVLLGPLVTQFERHNRLIQMTTMEGKSKQISHQNHAGDPHSSNTKSENDIIYQTEQLALQDKPQEVQLKSNLNHVVSEAPSNLSDIVASRASSNLNHVDAVEDVKHTEDISLNNTHSATSFFLQILTQSRSPLKDILEFSPSTTEEGEFADALLQFIKQYISLTNFTQREVKEKTKHYEQVILDLKATLKKQAEIYEKEVSQHQHELEQYAKTLQHLRIEKEKTDKLLQEQKNMLSQQKKSFSQMNLDVQEEAEYYKNEFHREQKTNENLNKTIKMLTEQLEKQVAAYKKLEIDFEALESGVEDLEIEKEREISSMRMKIDKMEKSSLSIQSQLTSYQEMEEKFNALASEHNRLNMDLKTMQNSYLSIQKQNQKLEHALDNMITRINDDTFIDRRLVFQFLKNYFIHLGSESFDDHLENLSSYLCLNADQKNELSTLLSMPGNGKVTKDPNPSSLQGKSLSELWVNFLYNQSKKGT